MTLQLADFLNATLTANLLIDATAFNVSVSSGVIPAQESGGELLLMIGSGSRSNPSQYEIVRVRTWTSGTFSNVQRAQGGTAARAWPAASSWVSMRVGATLLTEQKDRWSLANPEWGASPDRADNAAQIQACFDAASAVACARDPYPALVGMNWQADCACGHTDAEGGSPATGLYTLDSYAIQAGDRVLLPAGIYTAAAGAWTLVRASTPLDAVRILNGKQNRRRRVYVPAFGGAWVSWEMTDSVVTVAISGRFKITAPIYVPPGVTTDCGEDGCIVRNFGGSYTTPAIWYQTQAGNVMLTIESLDGGSGAMFNHNSPGFWQRSGTVRALDRRSSATTTRTRSVGVEVQGYSHEFSRITSSGFAGGVVIRDADFVCPGGVQSLAAEDFGIFFSGTTWERLNLHVDSIGASRYPAAKQSIGVALYLAAGDISITGMCLDGQGDALVAFVDSADADLYGTYFDVGYLSGKETNGNLKLRVRQVGERDPNCVLRLHQVGNLEFEVLVPERQFAYWKSWDGTNKRWDLDSIYPARVVDVRLIGQNVIGTVQVHPNYRGQILDTSSATNIVPAALPRGSGEYTIGATPTAAPAAATNLATALTLVNDLKARIIAMGGAV